MVNARDFLQQPTERPAILHKVDNRSQRSAETVHPMDAGHEQVAKRTLTILIVELQKLGLVLGDIDVAGTLRLAALAHQTKVENVVNVVAVGQWLLTSQRQA